MNVVVAMAQGTAQMRTCLWSSKAPWMAEMAYSTGQSKSAKSLPQISWGVVSSLVETHIVPWVPSAHKPAWGNKCDQ